MYDPFYWLERGLDREYEEQILIDKEKAAKDDEKNS